MKLVIPVTPDSGEASTGPSARMPLTSEMESDIASYVTLTFLQALTTACTTQPLDVDAVSMAATAHKHHTYVKQLNAVAKGSKRATAAIEKKAEALVEAIGRPNLTDHIQHHAAEHRPIVEGNSIVLSPKAAPVRTRAAALVLALWDLRHAASLAARSILADISPSAPESTAGSLSAAIETHSAVAISCIKRALRTL